MRKLGLFFGEEEPLDEPLVNLTPLIDVVFVVLIAFMIIAPVLDMDRVDLAQKGDGKRAFISNSPLSITVYKDNTIWVTGCRITLSQLEKWLKQEKKSEQRVKLIHDRDASFGTYQTIKNLVEACGFEELDVVLRPQ